MGYYEEAEERSRMMGTALRERYKTKIEVEGSTFVLAECAKNAAELAASIIRYVYWEKPCEEVVRNVAKIMIDLDQIMIIMGDNKIIQEKVDKINEIFHK